MFPVIADLKYATGTTQQEDKMPYINIKHAGPLSREQKAKIAEEVTKTMELSLIHI